MSYEIVVSPDNKEDIVRHENDFGRFNNPPPNFTEITAEEFAQSGFFTWGIEKIEHRHIDPRQIDKSKTLSPISEFLTVRMFFMNHGEGFAMSHHYWEKKIRYFKFAKCFHEWTEISAAEAGKPAMNCYHYCKCSKCGAQWEYDSSG